MTLSNRIILNSVVSFLIIATSALVFYSQKKHIEQNSKEVTTTDEVLKQSAELEKLVLNMEIGYEGYLLTGKAWYLEPYYSAIATYPENIINLQKMLSEPGQISKLQSIKSKIELWNDYATYIIDLKKGSTISKEAMAVFEREVDEKIRTDYGKRIIDQIRAEFAKFNKIEIDVQQHRLQKLNSSLDRANGVIITLALFSLLFSVVVTMIIVSSIRKRIYLMVGHSQRLASGNFDLNIEDHSRDELSSLSTSLNKMALDLKQAFEERKKAEDNALLSERKFRQLVEDATDIIYRCDPLGNFVYVNPMAVKLTGYSESELLNMSF
ncbi:MAG TPA: CHASE3 domain-containing protein, partial [Cytophagales bacterium]|nr:CHASE3 domain-containing protein [Cytophagales bacterium]